MSRCFKANDIWHKSEFRFNIDKSQAKYLITLANHPALWARTPAIDHRQKVINVHSAVAAAGCDVSGAAWRAWRWAVAPRIDNRQQVIHVHAGIATDVCNAWLSNPHERSIVGL